MLKCDIRKFFASIDHEILTGILAPYIPDHKILWLVDKVIASFDVGVAGKGLPLGNLTSQLFCNVYMNEFDQFITHKLLVRHYLRYADDFVVLSENKNWLDQQAPTISKFLQDKLKLSLHRQKVFIKTFASGVDFLGWVHFPTHRVMRTATKKRMLRRIQQHPTNETLQSYLGLLSHSNTNKLEQELANLYGLFAPRIQDR